MKDFEDQMRTIAEEFINAPSTPLSEARFRERIREVVAGVYSEGRCFLDRDEKPIRHYEDVEIIVTRGKHSMTASTIRRMP